MTRWIRDLNFSTKLVAIAIAAVVPVIVLTALFLTDKQHNINVAVRELSGMQRYQNLEAMLRPLGIHEVVEHRGCGRRGSTGQAAGRQRRGDARGESAGRQQRRLRRPGGRGRAPLGRRRSSPGTP